MKLVYRIAFLLLGIIVLHSSCEEDTRSIEELNEENIKNYMLSQGISNAVKDTLGLYYVILNQEGETLSPTLQLWSMLTVTYTGRLTNGTVFDNTYESTPTDPKTFPKLGKLIKGWQYGLPKLTKKNSRIRLLIPSTLGYGKSGATNIPGNSVLDFDITLIDAITDYN